ncbi:SGNH/GDSL hydrolase family protein [Thiohalocapsa marina]|uniref:SGNH/GDSL hydrolase family protein n=1 Tax=Thiohalocapsa marina TaxID=424902 RepID=A0A5M8FIZ8_9GAMM|nr:SGNH/GDSL hydrolase family protein [Thiohalocapsa marina]KAA6184647.1 SGNH/GDSL hydrolase family protein [Thiohalocapsa marina]
MRKISLVLVWLGFVFLLLQGAGFLFYQLEVSKPVSGYGYPAGLTIPHAQLGYHYQPGFSGLFKGSAYQQIPIDINDQGFRDDPFDPVPGEGRRVAVLGDSVVFGAGVAQTERFTECLEQRGDKGAAGRRILNLGVNAYTIGHYATLARADFLGTGPEAVLVGITLNDFEAMESVGPARRMQRHAEELHKPTWIARIQERIGRLYAVRFVEELETRLTYALMNADEREDYHTKWMRSAAAGWQQAENRARFERELDALIEAMQTAELPHAFVLFPELNALREPAEFDAPRQLLRSLLNQRGQHYCDPYDDFARQPDLQALFLDRDSVHYTPLGHEVLCAAIERCIDAQALPGVFAPDAVSGDREALDPPPLSRTLSGGLSER